MLFAMEKLAKLVICALFCLPDSLGYLRVADSELTNICGYDWVAIAGASSPNMIYRNCGATEPIEWWKTQPRLVGYPHADPDGLYTLLMYDPSVPEELQPGKVHWLVSNIPGKDILRADLTEGETLFSYLGPGAPIGTGRHNYAFLLYKQQQQQTIIVPEQRPNFSVNDWLKSQQPSLWGPVATNCIKVAHFFYDNSRPQVDRVKCEIPVIYFG